MNEQEIMLINEIELLHENKAELIATMQELGIDVTSSTPLRVIAERMREVGGKSCVVKIATVEQTESGDYRHRFFSQEEWQEMDTSVKQMYPRVGVLLIAEGHRLIIAKEYQTRSADNDSIYMSWSTNNVDVAGLTNYGNNTYGMILDYDSRGNTEKILAHATTLEEGFMIAPMRAHEYRGCLNDPTYWCLGAAGHMMLISKYRTEIDAALALIGGVPIGASEHWTSTECDSSRAYYVAPGTGVVTSINKMYTSLTYLVRPVAELD